MSRTRKDRPHWVRSNDTAEPRKERHHHDVLALYGVEDCTIDEQWKPGGWNNNRRPCYSYIVSEHYQYSDEPTRTDRHNQWYGPERGAVRDEIAKVKSQHRAGINLEELDDSSIPVRQHRHTPWSDGYWG